MYHQDTNLGFLKRRQCDRRAELYSIGCHPKQGSGLTINVQRYIITIVSTVSKLQWQILSTK